MSNQITCVMHFFVDPKKAQLGHLVKRHNGCILKDNKLVSRFSPGVGRASKLQDALWRKIVETHYVAWGNQLKTKELVLNIMQREVVEQHKRLKAKYGEAP